jgi:hypothetical protein
MRSAFDGRPMLIVFGEIDLFAIELQDALDKTGANGVIARTPAEVMRHLQRFKCDAVVVNHSTDGCQELIEELTDTPTLVLCGGRAAGVAAAVGNLAEARQEETE